MKIDRGYRKPNLPDNAKRVFEGVLFDVYQWDQKLYDGSTAVFEKVVRADTVSMFPILDDGKIVLIEDSQPHREMILTSPSGRVEIGETPLIAARRELLEETGYSASSWEPFYDVAPVGKVDWMVYAFIAKGLKKIQEPQLDPGERIAIKLVTFDELLAIVQRGDTYRDDFTQVVLHALADPKKMDVLRAQFAV